MYSNKAKENRHHHSHSSHYHQHHHHHNQIKTPSLGGASSFTQSSACSSKHHHHQTSLGEPTSQNYHNQQPAIIREKGGHSSRTTTIMPHKSIITGGSLSPVSQGTSSGGPGWYNISGSFRRDSGGSGGSDRDRRGSESSNRSGGDRRDSGGSSYSSSNGRRGRKDSEESATNVVTTRIMEDHFARDRRDSGGSDKSEEGTGGKQKKGILRQLMKWSSPGHHFKSKKGKAGKEAKKDKGEEDEEVQCQFKMDVSSAEKFNADEKEASFSPVTSPRKGSHSRASTLTDVTNSRSDSEDCHSCSSCSCSGSESGSEDDNAGAKEEQETVTPDVKKEDNFDTKEGARYAYRPNYYSYYQDLPRRVRSQSADFVYARKELRRRRFSENHEWIKGDNRKDPPKENMLQHEKVPEEEDWTPKTIYQAILHEMGKFYYVVVKHKIICHVCIFSKK